MGSLAKVIQYSDQSMKTKHTRKTDSMRKSDVQSAIVSQQSTKRDLRTKARVSRPVIDRPNASIKEDERTVDKKQENVPREQAINWPKSNSQEWRRFEEDVSKRLKIIMASPEMLARVHPEVIYNMGTERFGEI